jgi:hypothetical protein
MTGADVCTPGVAGAAIGGVLSATAITKRNFFGKVMGGKYEPKLVPGPSLDPPVMPQAAE